MYKQKNLLKNKDKNLSFAISSCKQILITFRNQFPYCYIFKVNENFVILKFVIFDFKETSISFKNVEDSPMKVTLPEFVYEVSESLTSSDSKTDSSEKDMAIYNKSDRCVILYFKTEPQLPGTHIFKFKIVAEYVRLEPKTIEYIMEIKYKL